MTMLTDGLKSQSLEEQIAQLDVVELLEKSCVEIELPKALPPEPTPEPEKPEPEKSGEAEKEQAAE